MEIKNQQAMNQNSILVLDNLSKIFGGLAAVSSVSMTVNKGELIGLIGPNGAGKTTLFNVISGVYNTSEGDVYIKYNDKEICLNNVKPYKATAYGIARTFQNIRLFSTRSVLDNVRIAMNKDCGYGIFSALFRTDKFYKIEAAMEKKALEILKVFNLDKKADELATNLPYGEQRLLEIARALATDPSILFLDEPAAGMNPNETKELTKLIRKIRDDFNITVILIEHDMSLVMDVCEKIFVLEQGKLIASGSSEQIKNNKRVIVAYLGEEE